MNVSTGRHLAAMAILFAAVSLGASIAPFLADARQKVSRTHRLIAVCRSIRFAGDSCLIGVEPRHMPQLGCSGEKSRIESIKVMRDTMADEPGWIGLAVTYEVSDGQGSMLPMRRYASIPAPSVLSLPALKPRLFSAGFFIDTLTPAAAVAAASANTAPMYPAATPLYEDHYTAANEPPDPPQTNLVGSQPSYGIESPAQAAGLRFTPADRTMRTDAQPQIAQAWAAEPPVGRQASIQPPIQRVSPEPFNPPITGKEPDFSAHARIINHGPAAQPPPFGKATRDLELDEER